MTDPRAAALAPWEARWKPYVTVHICGHGIYETLTMPVVPRKGDILALSSLTMGRCKVLDAVVVGVEWTRDQTQAFTGENEGIGAWVYVHRVNRTRLRGIYRLEADHD
jgi:hypothetical protein